MAQKKEDELLYDPQESVAGGGSKTGASGTGQNATGKSSGGGTQIKYGDNFTYQSAPDYVSKYQDQIDKLTESLLNRDKFEYDPETDPLYQQYADTYTRKGQRAMQDTLGQVSARTGGLASSYASSAAQQTYDNYMTELSDKIPELRQLAYSMYMDDYNTQYNNLQLLNALEQGDFDKYQSLLNQYNADRNFQYGVYSDDWNRNYTTERDKIADDRYNKEWEYNVGRDKLADERYDKEWEYNVGRDKLADERYDREWNYNLERDKLADQRYDREWNYNVQRDNIADQRYNQEWNYQVAQNAAKAASSGNSRSAGYKDVVNQAKSYDSLEEAADYLARQREYGVVTPEEADYIFSTILGGAPEDQQVSVPTTYLTYALKTGDPNILQGNIFDMMKKGGDPRLKDYHDYQDYLSDMFQKRQK